MSEMVALSDEQFVREHWNLVRREGFPVEVGLPGERWPKWIRIGDGLYGAWKQASAFTEERLEQIRQVEREVKSCEWRCLSTHEMVLRCIESGSDYGSRIAAAALCFQSRILAREEAVLDDLRRGMRS